MSSLPPLDWAIIGLYLVGVLLVGLYAGGRQESTRDYFIGDRSLPWWAVTLSIVATETSAVTFIGVPGLAYNGDWYFLQVVFGFVLGRVFLGFFFLRIFYRFDILTVYTYLEKRYDLMRIGVVLIHPARPPGARHLSKLRKMVQQKGVQCLFREPQFEPRLSDMLLQGTSVRSAVLDPLGQSTRRIGEGSDLGEGRKLVAGARETFG